MKKSAHPQAPIHFTHGARSCIPAVDTRVLLLLRLGATAFFVGHLVFFFFDSLLSITRYSDWALLIATLTFLLSVVASLLDVIREDDENVHHDAEDPLDCDSQLDDSVDEDDEECDHGGNTIPYHAGTVANSNSSDDAMKRSRKVSKQRRNGSRSENSSDKADAQTVREENRKFPLASFTAYVLARFHQVSLPMCLYSAFVYWTFFRPSLPSTSGFSLSYSDLVINIVCPVSILLNALFSRAATMRLLIVFPPYLAIHLIYGLVYFLALRSPSTQAPYPYVDRDEVPHAMWARRIAGLAFGALIAPCVTTFLGFFIRKMFNLISTLRQHRIQSHYDGSAHVRGNEFSSSSDSNDDDDKSKGRQSRKSSFFNSSNKNRKRSLNQPEDDTSATKRRKSSNEQSGSFGFHKEKDNDKATYGDNSVTQPLLGAAIDTSAVNSKNVTDPHASDAAHLVLSSMTNSVAESRNRSDEQPTRSRSLLDTQVWSTTDIAEDSTIIPVSSEKTIGEDRASTPPSIASSKAGPSGQAPRSKRRSLISSRSGSSICSDGTSKLGGGGSKRESSWTDLHHPAPVVEDAYFKMPAVLEAQGLERDVVRLPSPTRSPSSQKMHRSGSADRTSGVFARVGSASKVIMRRCSSASASTFNANHDVDKFPSVKSDQQLESGTRALERADFEKGEDQDETTFELYPLERSG